MGKGLICIACSIFKTELELIRDKHSFDFDIIYLDSMLHMYPDKLSKALNRQKEKYSEKKIILLYGDCFADMIDLEKEANVYRSPGINCCNIVLEKSRYKEIRKEGGFILMDEWVERWQEVFKTELGFTKEENARMFMQEMHSKLVYLDSGNKAIPHKTLQEISAYCGLPLFIEKTHLNVLEKTIIDALNWVKDENR